MFAYIKGILEEVDEQRVVLEVGGIGYGIIIPQSIIIKLPPIGTKVKLYTYFNVREDAQELYGFFELEEKGMFEKLITVSGIGPKVAMGILSALTPTQIALAIVNQDIKTLCIAPGVGKKTAQRMILELKEKIDTEALITEDNGEQREDAYQAHQNEVIEALTSLGYQAVDARRAFNSIEDKEQDVSTLIKLSLKLMDRG